MTHYTPKKLRPWSLTAFMLRGLARLLSHWPIWLVIALIFSPLQPYLRLQYRYIERGSEKLMIDCDYFGMHGWLKYQIGTRCPVIAIIDMRDHS
jgi:hypothetical protein